MVAPTLSWSSERVRPAELLPTPHGAHVHHCACGRYAFCRAPIDDCRQPFDRCPSCEYTYVALMQKNAEAAAVPCTIGSLYGALTRQGLVTITLGKETTTMDVRKAREIHDMLGQAIEAAISDETFVTYLTTKAGLSLPAAAAALIDLREIRQGTRDVVRPF